jgi:hypothetical protein
MASTHPFTPTQLAPGKITNLMATQRVLGTRSQVPRIRFALQLFRHYLGPSAGRGHVSRPLERSRHSSRQVVPQRALPFCCHHVRPLSLRTRSSLVDHLHARCRITHFPVSRSSLFLIFETKTWSVQKWNFSKPCQVRAPPLLSSLPSFQHRTGTCCRQRRGVRMRGFCSSPRPGRVPSMPSASGKSLLT